MRIRVTWPDGRERRGAVRTWRELARFVGTTDLERRRVSVDPEGDAFHIVIHDDD